MTAPSPNPARTPSRYSGVWPILILLLGVVGMVLSGCREQSAPSPTPSLADHPLYKAYAFSKEEKTIDFGIQPLWLPVSNLTEFMRRDPILHEELQARGYTIAFHPFLKGSDLNEFLRGGQLEAGVCGDMPTLRALAVGDLVTVSLAQEGSVAVVARGLKEISQLRGKKIGYARGSNAHFFLINTLRKYQIPLTAVTLVPMEVTEMAAALHNGTVDAFAAWDPTPTIATTKYPELQAVHRGRTYGFLTVRGKFSTDHPEAVALLLASEIRALRWLRKNNHMDQGSGWSLAAGSRLLPDLAALSIPTLSELAWQDLPGILIKEYPRLPTDLLEANGQLAKEFALLQELGFIEPQVLWSELTKKFDRTLLERVIANQNRYRLLENFSIPAEVGKP